MTPCDVNAILEKASVPEHSVNFMRAMSGGEPFQVGHYLFISIPNGILCVGYPLGGEYHPDRFEEALTEALHRTRAGKCWAICPSLPGRLQAYRRERDAYYVLPLDATIPGRLERLAERAATALRVDQGITFTAAHRRLWDEFTARTALRPNVRELYTRTQAVLQQAGGVSLLNAWDRDGNLAACLLMDSAPRRFASYLLGAYSRNHYTAYASDLLLRELIRTAAGSGKEFVHLGLGVNDGIRRFKTKWGGRPSAAYELAEWTEEAARPQRNGLLRMLAAMPSESGYGRRALEALPRQKRFAMLWEIKKHERRSWIGGTAHFFCCSFENSFRKLFAEVDTVIFEGPLDQTSMEKVAAVGRSPAPGSPSLIDHMREEEIRMLERVVCGPRGAWARLLGLQTADPPNVRFFLSQTRPWMAFFSLWTSFLARHGWNQSVDLEAWRLAREMGKRVHAMETIAEQIETLESIPMPRIVNFFRQCRHWRSYIQRNAKAYLKGDIDAMAGTSIEFPTRTELVIGRRDANFLACMQPFLEEGRCAVLVGTAHMFNLRRMIAAAGFDIRRA
ncbi:MAG: TraB/GumN family protein [Hyphomicrobiales bacterium]